MTAFAGLAACLVASQALRGHALTLASLLAGALLSAVWEGAVLVAAVAVALRLVPGLSAALRARLWLVVLFVLMGLPVLPMVLPAVLPGLLSQRAGIADMRPLQVSAMWSVWVACAWAVLTMARAAQLAAGAQRLRRIAREAVPVDAGTATAALLQHAGRPVELCVSAEVGRPSVVGFFRPRILLPPSLLAALSPDELRQVLLHEMEHLRRRDDWTNLAQKLALVAMPLHPALFWVERRLCAERELACDDGVLRAAGDGKLRAATRKAYAACLVSLAEHAMLRRGAALALGAWERQSELARRVHRILRRPEPAARPAVARLAVGGVLGGVLAASVLLAGSPQLLRFVPGPSQPAMTVAQVPSRMLTAAADTLADVGRVTSGGATLQPVVTRRPGGRPRMTLASAVLPARSGGLRERSSVPQTASDVHALNAARFALRTGSGLRPAHRASKARATRPSLPLRRGGSLRQVSYRTTQDSPRLVLLTAWPSAAPLLTLRVEGSDNEFSQSYAAVPMQGGWLLVQL